MRLQTPIGLLPLLFCNHSHTVCHRRIKDVASSSALCGIKGFRAWFEGQFPSAVKNITPDYHTDSFDHVLIDINQLLHISLRRAKNEDHALVLTLKEVDKCLAQAQPKRSVVLALDGPPSAAKLVTQRRRRCSTLNKAEAKRERIEMMARRGLTYYKQADEQQANTNRNKKKSKRKKKRRVNDEATLCITPGTEFMRKAANAFNFWAWQRMSNPFSVVRNCRVYISTSDVPGEGEVKLLDWLMMPSNEHVILPGDSVVFMGGDSDLVLEALVLPVAITHNVFVILPEDQRKAYSVSLWETTRVLHKYLPTLDMRDMMHVRMDLVLLLIMNGNDYLPKLRGSAGFNKLFHAYLRMLRDWMERNKHNSKEEITEFSFQRPFFINNGNNVEGEDGINDNNAGISFNLPFCISFFRELANNAPQNLARREQMRPIEDSFTALSSLYRFIDSGFLPPCEFEVLPSEKEGHETVRLAFVGTNRPGWEDVSDFEVDHREKTNIQSTKQRLAHMALADVLGPDWEESINDEKADYEEAFPWETDVPAESDVEQYLGGLLWNLQTYQDGICANYGYNYGRRMAPTAQEVANFFELQAEKPTGSSKLGRRELIGDEFVDPLDAGLSCLAAIPNKASYLIPPPYNAINETKVDDIYVACMDAACNIFDVDKFRSDCLKEIERIGTLEEAGNNSTSTMDHNGTNKAEKAIGNGRGENGRKSKQNIPKGRIIYPRTKHWTVFSISKESLQHPFEPPQPISEGISRLRRNKNIRVSYVPATTKPKWMRDDVAVKSPSSRRKNKRKPRRMGNTVNIMKSLGKDSIRDFDYKTAYSDAKTSKKMSVFEKEVRKAEKQKKKIGEAEYSRTTKSLGETERATTTMPKQKHGLTALSTLNELVQAQKIFCKPEWDTVKVPNVQGTPRRDLIYLKIGPPNGEWKKTYEATRVEYDQIRSVKHQLASAALDDFVDNNWRELKTNDMEPRDISESPPANVDKDFQSNIENLKL